MKGIAVHKRIFYSSWILALIPALAIYVFLPPIGSKFKIIAEAGEAYKYQSAYADLNSDNISEVISTGKGIPLYYIVVLSPDFKVYDQWNFQDTINPMISKLTVGNFDNDNYSEIYIFTHKGDSLFLNVNEFLEHEGTKMDRIYITKVSCINGELTSNVEPAGFFDQNGDGYNELYFIISTGMGLSPRRAYFYDLINNELKFSQFAGMICQQPEMVDSDGDKRPEIFGMMSASGNYKTRVPYSDSSTWFMVFNDQLEFEFPPVEIFGFANLLETKSYSNGLFRGYLLSHFPTAADTTLLKACIMVFSVEGKLIRTVPYADFGFKTYPFLVVMKSNQSDRIYLLGEEFLELDENLNILKRIKSPFKSRYIPYNEDIDGDGEDELLVYSQIDEKLEIYRAGLRKYAGIQLKIPENRWIISHDWSKGNIHRLYVNAGADRFFLSIKKNNYYYLGYALYPGIYLLFILFIFIIKRINTFQVVQKESLKRRLITLQLQGIKAQLDPHFTFNALNSVASLVYMDDRKTAYDYLNKFTHLIRRLLNDAERIYRDLEEELEFVTIYLELEKLRFGDKFSYEISVGEGVSMREQVPKLVLQTFAENAIKHGIMPRVDGGVLKINVRKESDYLLLTIEDNGIGRALASGLSSSTGKGLKLNSEFYDILNKINRRPIKHNITDLYDKSGNPAGTRVEVHVPVGNGIDW